MKKLFLVIILIFASLSSCRKGEGDPIISFRSRTYRLTGEWKLKSGSIISKETNTYEEKSRMGSIPLILEKMELILGH